MIGLFMRRTVFWSLDRVKGKPIRNAYKDIEEKITSGEHSTLELKNLIDHTIETVPHYKALVQGGRVLQKLSDFPVMTKADYKENYEAFLSEEYKGKKLHEMSTSGSTGTPFVVKMDMRKRKRVNAEFIYFNRIAGQKLGDRYMYLKTWKKKKSELESLAQNVIAIDILKLNETTLEKIRMQLKSDKKIRSILAYASTYEILADYLVKKGDSKTDFNLDAIFTSSTLMTKTMKDKLEELFGCPVIDRYSSQENGLLAQTAGGEDFFRINTASYHIELLSLHSDEPVNPREVGRVVVTDIYNYAMPMIRYDTGDLAVSDDEHRSHLMTLKNLEGRRVDIIYDTRGNLLTPHTWSVHMRKYEKVLQWQFIQEDRNMYRLMINGGEKYYTSEDFERTLKGILGEDAKITIEFLETIPVLASGKFKNTICLYDPMAKGKV